MDRTHKNDYVKDLKNEAKNTYRKNQNKIKHPNEGK